MTYDQWKTESGYSERDYDDWDESEYNDRDCEHENPDIDILTGSWDCYKCGEHRAATQDEIDAEIEFHREYSERERRERRRDFWLRLTFPIRWPIFRLLARIWPKKAHSVISDYDDIPF